MFSVMNKGERQKEKKDSGMSLMFSDDMGTAREKENQNTIQKEMSWRMS